MTKEEYEKNKEVKEEKPAKRFFKRLIRKTLITIILCLSFLIIVNNSEKARIFVEEKLFNSTFKFSKINNFFNKYFINEDSDTIPVVQVDNTLYKNIENFGNGAVLTMEENTNVKLIESGIVVFVGEKEKYGNTIIVQQSNGIDAWYGNLKDVNVKLYDYVEKNSTIGSSNTNLYLLFESQGDFLDYKEFIK